MKMNFTTRAIALNGEPLKERGEEIWLNKTLAGVIMMQDASDATVMQKYELATRLYKADGDMEISESEKNIIKGICENGKLPVIIAAQILMIVGNAR